MSEFTLAGKDRLRLSRSDERPSTFVARRPLRERGQDQRGIHPGPHLNWKSLTQVKTDSQLERVQEIVIERLVTPHPVEDVFSVDEYGVTHERGEPERNTQFPAGRAPGRVLLTRLSDGRLHFRELKPQRSTQMALEGALAEIPLCAQVDGPGSRS